MKGVCAWVMLLAWHAVTLAGAPTVGMEGRLEIQLPGTLLEAKPVEPRAPLILRIADHRPHGTLIAYDLRYVGLEPGSYDLREYLMRQDGSATEDLPHMVVEVSSLLPAEHNGILIEEIYRPFPFMGGYKWFIIVIAAIWVVLLWPLIWQRRPRRLETETGPAPSEPTVADRLQPLVEQAARGTLGQDGQALLERLLLAYWRQRLDLSEVDPVEAMRQLRQHPEAGQLLRQLDNWLHRPAGHAESVNVHRMLEPYRQISP